MAADLKRREIRIPIPALIGVFFFLFTLSLMGGKPGYSSDSNENFNLSMTILRQGDFFPDHPSTQIYHGYAYSILPLPFYVLADVAGRLYPAEYQNAILRMGLVVYNMVVTSLSLVLFYLIGRRVGFSKRVALSLTLALGLTTLVLPYARYDFNQPNANLFLFLTAWFLLRWWDDERMPDLLGAGISAGVGLLSRAEYGLLVLPLAAALAARRTTSPRAWAAVLIPVLAALAFHLGYNAHYWGADKMLMGGYGTHVHRGSVLTTLWGIFLSPGKSAFLYNPVLLLSVSGLPLLVRRHGGKARLFAGCCLVVFGFYCFALYWWGGWSWGPRLVLPLLPAAVLGIGALLTDHRAAVRRASWTLLVVLGLAGFGIQMLGLLVDFNDGIRWYTVVEGVDEMAIYTDWKHHPFRAHWQLIGGSAENIPLDLLAAAHVRAGNAGAFLAVYVLIVTTALTSLVLLVQQGYFQEDEGTASQPVP